jgi:Tfp pilus assembly PilM family ATPase
VGNGNQKNGNPTQIFVDIGLSTVKILAGSEGMEFPLTRDATGRLVGTSQDAVREALTRCRDRDRRGMRVASCGLPASGVSVRRFRLPPASRDATRRLVNLQLEQSFPVSPDQLAWGYRIFAAPVDHATDSDSSGSGRDVAALVVKRNVIEDYETLFNGSGIRPVFTLGILAAGYQALVARQSVLVVDVGRSHSECLWLDRGVPVQVRTLTWGGDAVTTALAGVLGADREEAGKRKREPMDPATSPMLSQALRDALRPLVHFLTEAVAPLENVRPEAVPGYVLLVGGGAGLPGLTTELSAALGGRTCRVAPDPEPGPGRSAVTLGLRELSAGSSEDEPISFACEAAGHDREARAVRRRLVPWMVLAGALLVAIVGTRYLPAVFGKQALARELATARERVAMLPETDRELRFLDELERRRLRVLEALTVTALAAPPGAALNEFSLNSRGVLSVKVTLKPSEYNEFRARLIRSGWFSDVVLQRLQPGKGGVILPLTAQLTPPRTGLTGVVEKLGSRPDSASAPVAAATRVPPLSPAPRSGSKTPSSDAPADDPSAASGTARNPTAPGKTDGPDRAEEPGKPRVAEIPEVPEVTEIPEVPEATNGKDPSVSQGLGREDSTARPSSGVHPPPRKDAGDPAISSTATPELSAPAPAGSGHGKE